MSKPAAKPVAKSGTKSSAQSQALARAKAAQQKATNALRPPALAEGSIMQSLYGTVAGLIMTAALLAFVYGNERADLMFAIQQDGQLTPLQAMSYPNTSSEAVVNWTRLAVGEIFTYNFNDIVPRLNSARNFFTTRGWNSFRTAFQEQSILAQIRSQRMFVTTLPSGAAVVIEEGDVKGRYYWTVQLETITSVYTGSASINFGGMTVKIERISTEDSAAGYPFGIVQISY
jgi:hypothetical protein